MQHLEDHIFNIKSAGEFSSLALDIFRLQSTGNSVYSRYLSFINIDPGRITKIEDIPFLPIELFRSHRIVTGDKEPEIIFRSSGTTASGSGNHYVVSEKLYQKSFLKSFTTFCGNPEDLCILALLPSYLERDDSSLVYMMNHLIGLSRHPESGFYLNNYAELKDLLIRRNDDGHPTLLLGVSFALIDLAEKFPLPLSKNIRVMETGGMKGRKKEMIREELHSILKNAFSLENVESEYGMTELLSQAYSAREGIYSSPPWMKVMTRDLYDPMSINPPGRSGGINIIDLANIYSCSFIATGDVGKVMENGTFEIAGRSDHSETRGCNLMVL
jgi:phenylacetate-coenzyme A ligase PaaK-like adenylate-forming protein